MNGQLSDEVAVREARQGDAEGIAYVHITAWQTAYRGILPASYLDALTPAARYAVWQNRLARQAEEEFTFVAEVATRAGDEERQLVGFAAGGPERDGIAPYDHEIWGIYLLEEWRGRGIGRRLVAAAASWVVERGGKSLLLWVLKDNWRARAFYEALGGERLPGEKSITIGSSSLLELAYGWPDAAKLTGSRRDIAASR
ncbi:MAG TPA: GNAT family N-acetyltransferase [Phycisphaerae bacterium]|nr:GNAT family N-acetyltransferase [Phycisphaerae bacterium]